MNILEKYYLQGKGKIILGTFALIVLFIISTVMLPAASLRIKKMTMKIQLLYLIMAIILM